jgi:hypothetical protein
LEKTRIQQTPIRTDSGRCPMKKILLPLDDSIYSTHALQYMLMTAVSDI